jgi:hypothetical protein
MDDQRIVNGTVGERGMDMEGEDTATERGAVLSLGYIR